METKPHFNLILSKQKKSERLNIVLHINFVSLCHKKI